MQMPAMTLPDRLATGDNAAIDDDPELMRRTPVTALF